MSALGNWKTKKTMSSHYAWSKEAMSFIVKYTCVEAVRRTSAQKEILHGTEKAWEFSWGDISRYVQDSSDIVQEAGKHKEFSSVLPKALGKELSRDSHVLLEPYWPESSMFFLRLCARN